MDPSDVLHRAARALEDMDAETLVSTYSEHFSFEDPSSGDYIEDKDGLRKYFDRLFSLPDVSFSNVDFFAAGTLGAGKWTWSGTSPKTGKVYTIRGSSLFKLANDGISQETIFYDPRPYLI
jgi:ketosteroid isomerase-like protein